MAAAFVLHSEFLATTGRALFVVESAIALALIPIVIERCRELLAPSDLAEARSGLAKLGSVPASADQTAALFASVAQVVFPAAAADVISDNRAAFMGFIAEFLASLMPWALYKGFAVQSAKKAQKPKPAPVIEPQLPETKTGEHDRTIAFLARHTVRDRDGRVPSTRLFQIWCADCKGHDVEPGTNTAFTQRLKNCVEHDTKHNRTTFTGISLKDRAAPPKLHVVEGNER